MPRRGPRINFTNAYAQEQTDASRAVLARGRGIGDAAIDTEFGDTFGGGTAGEISGRRLDAIAKNRPIKRGFGLTETNEPTDMQRKNRAIIKKNTKQHTELKKVN